MTKNIMWEKKEIGNGKSYSMDLEGFRKSYLYNHISSNSSDRDMKIYDSYYDVLFPEPEIIIEENPFNL